MKDVDRIVQLREHEVGLSERNVKQEIVAPLFELLGHKTVKVAFALCAITPLA